MMHLPHWTQISDSQTGISWATPRFSHLAVPVGYVPSQGKALTGSSSPLRAIALPNTSRTKGGAFSGTAG